MKTNIIGSEIAQSYTSADDQRSVYDDHWVSYSFTTSSEYTINKIGLLSYKVGNPGTLTASIRNSTDSKPTGGDLTSGTYNSNTLTTDSSGEWHYIDLTPYELSNGTEYHIVMRCLDGDVSNYLRTRHNDSGGNYGKIVNYSNNSGSDWSFDTSHQGVYRAYKLSTKGRMSIIGSGKLTLL